MKHKRFRLILFAALLLAFALLPGGALAADTEDGEPQTTAPPPASVYPAEVRTSESGGIVRLEKVYYLTARDDPSAIPTEDFDREGLHFSLLDVLKTDLTETEMKDYAEVVTLESETKDVGEIIKTMPPELELLTEDGFSGVLKPDYTTVTVEPAGYRTSTWTVTATRTYPNLSDADLSLLPKTVEENGRTLTLADVSWQEAAAEQVDGVSVPLRYTAVAAYTGTATGRSVTGYTVTVEYFGEVTKTSNDTVIYTAVFSAVNTSHGETYSEAESTEPPLDEGERSAPEAEPNPEPTAEAAEPGEGKSLILPLTIGGAVLALIAAYGIWRGLRHRRNKKRGYVK